jgi:transcription-repair coupling factor (superfamily II helicase)
MVIHRADMFGLAQLYQIRGRVGRAKTRAYAYLTTKPRAKLTPAAEKRLRVLGSLDSLGAGFTIASQDLDIRGAGNIVGEEQSGHVARWVRALSVHAGGGDRQDPLRRSRRFARR